MSKDALLPTKRKKEEKNKMPNEGESRETESSNRILCLRTNICSQIKMLTINKCNTK